jgi:DNA-binding transcriptional regulator YdaS (Cro superfamily)
MNFKKYALANNLGLSRQSLQAAMKAEKSAPDQCGRRYFSTRGATHLRSATVGSRRCSGEALVRGERHKMPPNATAMLTPKKSKAVQLIARGCPRKDVAAQIGVDPATLSRWRRDPVFRKEIERLIGLSEDESTQAMRGIRLAAVERLSSLIDSAQPSVALRAVELALCRKELLQPTSVTPKPEADAGSALFEQVLGELRQSLNQ